MIKPYFNQDQRLDKVFLSLANLLPQKTLFAVIGNAELKLYLHDINTVITITPYIGIISLNYKTKS